MVHCWIEYSRHTDKPDGNTEDAKRYMTQPMAGHKAADKQTRRALMLERQGGCVEERDCSEIGSQKNPDQKIAV